MSDAPQTFDLIELVTLCLSIGMVVSVCSAIWVLRRRRIKGKYDLESLREVHEMAELDGIEEAEVCPEADEVVCLACGISYNANLPVCPRCGRMPGH